jgi:hypothetical protein
MVLPMLTARVAATASPLVVHAMVALFLLLKDGWSSNNAARAATFLAFTVLAGMLSITMDYRLRTNVLLDWKLRRLGTGTHICTS